MSASENLVRRPDAKPIRPARTRRETMRVMVLVKATEDSEKGFARTAETMEAMGRFNDELRNAGILRVADGLKPSSQGQRIAPQPMIFAKEEPHDDHHHYCL
jgi:hypothetical protein